ncbi:MAG: hypothetical protein BWY76_02611 [bacterium ADurb.Bin429]|nr:MAG: hypothetical protein BWY76_02611 [bacterium ADurb.Bin429]
MRADEGFEEFDFALHQRVAELRIICHPVQLVGHRPVPPRRRHEHGIGIEHRRKGLLLVGLGHSKLLDGIAGLIAAEAGGGRRGGQPRIEPTDQRAGVAGHLAVALFQDNAVNDSVAHLAIPVAGELEITEAVNVGRIDGEHAQPAFAHRPHRSQHQFPFAVRLVQPLAVHQRAGAGARHCLHDGCPVCIADQRRGGITVVPAGVGHRVVDALQAVGHGMLRQVLRPAVGVFAIRAPFREGQ